METVIWNHHHSQLLRYLPLRHRNHHAPTQVYIHPSYSSSSLLRCYHHQPYKHATTAPARQCVGWNVWYFGYVDGAVKVFDQMTQRKLICISLMFLIFEI